MRKFINAKAFMTALVEAGVIDEIDTVHRVVIDARAGDMVAVYVERFADERWLDVVTPAAGFVVEGGE